MPFWTYQHLADVTRGRWLVKPDDLSAAVAGLWHDTREIKPGQAYLAIQGDNFDGHDFLDQAFNAGASLAIVSTAPDPVPSTPNPLLQVKDTVKALQDLARAYRDELKAGGCKVIGIAGSNGKTTTRHLIHHVLTHAGLKGTQSPRSFNNHLGVPLTLLSGKPQDDFLACEIGTNHPGEIDFLSAIARPDIAVITSIGEEHLEFFGNIRNVAKEEAAIFEYLSDDGIGIAPEDDFDRYLRKQIKRTDVNVVAGWYDYEKDWDSGARAIYGEHMLSNMCLAGSVAQWLDIESDCIDQLLESFKTPSGRNELLYFKELTVVHDAYNANPSSTWAAIDVLSEKEGRTVMVFGDMLELGEHSERAHQRIGCRAVLWGIHTLITIGSQAKYAALAAQYEVDGDPQRTRVHCFDEWTDELPDQVAALLQPGDTVLLKASRGMRLERLIPAIERRFGPASDDQPT